MLNQSGRAATKKLKMLDSVVTHLHKLVRVFAYLLSYIPDISGHFSNNDKGMFSLKDISCSFKHIFEVL